MNFTTPPDEQEDTEDYMEHEHFEDIVLPERDEPATTYDQEENLPIRDIMDNETDSDKFR